MSSTLRLGLLVFSIIWIVIILYLVRKEKLPVKYSLVWMTAMLIILLVAMFPIMITKFSELLGFVVVSNLVIGLILTLLLFITLVLTLLVYRQKKQIIHLIQEVSTMKNKGKK